MAILVRVVSKHNSQDKNRSSQEQYHILLAREKKKTAKESLLIWLYPTVAVIATPIDQSNTKLYYKE
jgi:hypothetical protein